MIELGEEVWLFVGIVGTVVAYTFHKRSGNIVQKTKSVKRKRVPPGRDVISLDALKELVKSPVLDLHRSAVQLLLDRAMSDHHFPDILYFCWDDADKELKQRAINVVQQLAKIESNRPLLVRWGVLRMLAHVISTENTETVYRNAVVTLYRLVNLKPKRKLYIVKLGVLDHLSIFLSSYPTHSNDLKYWSLLLIHQLALYEPLHKILIEKGFVPILGNMTRLTYGNSNMQKYCLHSLVRLLTGLESPVAEVQLQKLIDQNIPALICSCMKNDDVEMVSWAIFLMQEFVVKEFARNCFTQVKGIVRIMLNLMPFDDSVIPRIATRNLKCLSVRNESFQEELLKGGGLKKIVPLLKSSDLETQFWALALLHDLLMNFEYHGQFFELKGLEVLADLANTASTPLALYISDIFVFLCGTGRNRPYILKCNILDPVLKFCGHSESDLQYSGALLLLNLATFSGYIIDQISDRDGIQILSDFVLTATRIDTQIVAVKALATMARKDETVRNMILYGTLHPLVSKIVKAISSADYIGSLASDLESLEILILPNYLELNGSHVFPELHINVEPLCDCILDLLTLPFLAVSNENLEDLATSSFTHLKTQVDPKFASRIERVESALESLISDDEVSNVLEKLEASIREMFAIRALTALIPLFSYGEAKKYFEENCLVSALVALLRSKSKPLARQALMTLALCLRLGLNKSLLCNIPSFMTSFLKYILFDGLSISEYYGQFIFDCLADFTGDNALKCDTVYTQLDLDSITPYLNATLNKMEVRNDSWTFESVRANGFVSGAGKFGYEVCVKTDGIIQIGWAAMDAVFDPEGGEGVGDNEHSYAYDGQRRKKWHGYVMSGNDYGDAWSTGDTITSMIDLDEGTVSYSKNGVSIGIAFEGVDVTKDWYPAISLASAQGCALFFGSVLDPISYLPDGYAAVPPLAPVSISDDDSDTSSSAVFGDSVIQVDESHVWTVPSFYYEVTISTNAGNMEDPLPWQLGLHNGDNILYCLMPLDEHICLVTVTAESVIHSPLAESLHLFVSPLLKSGLHEVDLEAGKIVIGGQISGCKLREGDTLGCGILDSEQRICFSKNGHPLDVLFDNVDSDFTYFPYFRNFSRYHTNCGNTAFKWYPQEE